MSWRTPGGVVIGLAHVDDERASLERRGDLVDVDLTRVYVSRSRRRGRPGSGRRTALTDLEPADIKPIITRLKRANGHLASVIRMMEEGSSCGDILTQPAAVNKALSRAGYAIVATGLQHCLEDGEGVDGVEVKKKEKLFPALA